MPGCAGSAACERCSSCGACLLLGLERLDARLQRGVGLRARARRSRPGSPCASVSSGSASAFSRFWSAVTWLRSAADAVLQALQSAVTLSRSTTAITAAGSACAERRPGARSGAASAAERESYSLELSSYVEAEQFGVVAFLLEQGLGEIDAQRTERRHPVDADADRQARLGRIAEEEFLEARARYCI